MAADFPTPAEQYLVELINRARADPSAEASRLGIALNEGLAAGTISTAAKQPLAINPNLTDAAGKHSQWMIDNDVFSHYEDPPANTIGPQQRMTSAGYSFTGSWTNGENIGWRGQFPSVPNQTTTTGQIHDDLFIDASIAGRGHRVNLMNPSFREIGAGVVSGVFSSGGTGYNAVMATEDFAANSGNASGDSFLTGVTYTDAVTHDSFYTVGEGLGGVTITAVRASDSASSSTTTFSSGGYSLRLNPGTYTVTASGGGVSSPITYSNVVIGATNVKRDFVPTADTTPPTASNGAFLFETSPLRLSVKFSESVAASLASGDLQLRASGSASLIPVTYSGYDSAANVATFAISGTLPNGNYLAALPARSVADASGNSLAKAYSFSFYVLAGDASRDRQVDTIDFNILAAHYNQGGTFSQGDFNYDGAVNAADMSVLATNFDATISTTTAAAALPANDPFGRGFDLANDVNAEHSISFLLISEQF